MITFCSAYFFNYFLKIWVSLVQKAVDFFRLVSFKFNIEKIECVRKNLPKILLMNFNISFLIFSSIEFKIGWRERGQKKVFVLLSGIAQSYSVTKNQFTSNLACFYFLKFEENLFHRIHPAAASFIWRTI